MCSTFLSRCAARGWSALRWAPVCPQQQVHGMCSQADTATARPDVAVIGTGIMAMATARALINKGAQVVLVGPHPLAGFQATTAAGAMVDAFGELEYSSEHMYREQLMLRLEGQRKFPGWLSALEQEAGQAVSSKPGLYIIGNRGGDHDVAKLQFMQESMKQFNEPYQVVDPATVSGLAPSTGYQAHTALFIPGAMTVDTHQLQAAFATLMETSSAVKWHKEECSTLAAANGGWCVQLTSGHTLQVPQLVVCAGAQSQSLLGSEAWECAGLPPLHFGRGTSVLVNSSNLPKLPHAIRTPNRALACGLHIVPRGDDSWYIGSTNLFGTNLEAAMGPTCGELHTMLGQTSTELNTSLRNATITRVSWGLRPVTATGLPVFGATRLPGLYVACGTHRQGINVAPIVGETVADDVVSGQAQAHAFSPLQLHATQNVNLELGVRSLLATVLYPGGSMPYNRQREMEVFVTTLLRMVLADGGAGASAGDVALRARLCRLHSAMGLSEQAIIRLFHQVMEEQLPEGRPFVT